MRENKGDKISIKFILLTYDDAHRAGEFLTKIGGYAYATTHAYTYQGQPNQLISVIEFTKESISNRFEIVDMFDDFLGRPDDVLNKLKSLQREDKIDDLNIDG
jgi:hypothetical protein